MVEIAIKILLFFGVAVCALSSLGILVMDGMYDKLHYLAPMSTVGALAIIVAVMLEQGSSFALLKPVLLMLLLCSSSAVLTQATARAHRIRSERLKASGDDSC